MERITHGVFTVSFIRNGDVITVYTDVVKSNGDGTSLVQFWNPETGAVAESTNWRTLSLQPIIRIHIHSANNYPALINSVTWFFGGTELQFAGINDSDWVVASNDTRFVAKIEGGLYCLKIRNNLVSADFKGNKQISYNVNYTSLGMQANTSGVLDVWLRDAGSRVATLLLATNRKVISSANPTATVDATAYIGPNQISIGETSGYSLKWYDSDGRIVTEDEYVSQIIVTRAMVSGAEMIKAELYKGGVVVAQAAISIHDIDDEYQISHRPTDASGNFCTIGSDAKYILGLRRNGVDYTPEGLVFAWKVYNTLGEIKKEDGTGETVTVTSEHCKCVVGEGASAEEYYNDAQVEVSASWND